jgi:hypothetical protein
MERRTLAFPGTRAGKNFSEKSRAEVDVEIETIVEELQRDRVGRMENFVWLFKVVVKLENASGKVEMGSPFMERRSKVGFCKCKVMKRLLIHSQLYEIQFGQKVGN